MDLTAGVYAVHRWQHESDSNVWIVDGYLNWRFLGIFLEAEGYKIMGTSKAIAPKGDLLDDHACDYGTTIDDRQHLVVVKGELVGEQAPLVRVQSGYPLSSVFGDLFSDDRQVLNAALQHLGEEHRGVLLCLDRGRAETPLDARLRRLGEPAAPG